MPAQRRGEETRACPWNTGARRPEPALLRARLAGLMSSVFRTGLPAEFSEHLQLGSGRHTWYFSTHDRRLVCVSSTDPMTLLYGLRSKMVTNKSSLCLALRDLAAIFESLRMRDMNTVFNPDPSRAQGGSAANHVGLV